MVSRRPHVFRAGIPLGAVVALAGQSAMAGARVTIHDTEFDFAADVAIDGDTALIGCPGAASVAFGAGEAHVYRRVGAAWVEEDVLVAPDASSGDNFGVSVAIDGDTAVIGARNDAMAGGLGSAYVFVRTGSNWDFQQKLIASDDGTPTQAFGTDVAVAGDTAVIGAFGGEAFVFTRTSGVWTEQQRLTPGVGVVGSGFGAYVDTDGDTIVVGANRDDDNGESAGAAHVFVHSGGAWTLQQKISADDGMPYDNFGAAVSIEGDTLLIGANLADDPGLSAGSMYIFDRSGGTWTQQPGIVASDAFQAEEFGVAVAVSGDLAIVGAERDDNGAVDTGAAYLFSRTLSAWGEKEKLFSGVFASSQYFGRSVSISGQYAVIGAVRAATILRIGGCLAEMSGDDAVDGTDLAAFLTSWGETNSHADFNGDGIVDGEDLALMLAAWGPCD